MSPLLVVVAIGAFVAAVGILAGIGAVTIAQAFVGIVGLAALLAAAVSLSQRRDARKYRSTPDPERSDPSSVPGATLTDAIAQFSSRPSHRTYVTRRSVKGLRVAAIDVLTRFEGLTEEAATAAIDDGSWTDDPVASAFLSEDVTPPSRSIRDRLVDRIARDDPYRRGIRRTAAAIAEIGYGGLGDRTTPDDVPDRGLETSDESVETRTTDRRLAASELYELPSRATGHWTGIGVVALAAIGIGAFAELPAVVLTGVVGIGYAGFAYLGRPASPTLEIDRTVSDDDPDPGDEVDVTVSVTNAGSRPIPDLRYIDGVPADLAVTDGTARIGTAMRPGETVSLEYSLTVTAGTHEFDPALVVTRDLSRSVERTHYVGCPTELVCEPMLHPIDAPVPLQAATTQFTGRLTTSSGGSGTEFHSVREYRRNDPLNRIDWNRHARTGELATIEFHQERAARVLVLVDARKAAYVAPSPDAIHAVERSTGAAVRIAATLLESGDTVGLAGLGPTTRSDEDGDRGVCWLPPASGSRHRIRLREALATHPQFSTLEPPQEARWLSQMRTLRRRLSAETQIVLLTPLTDHASVVIARRLASHGHAVTVVSPDPTAERTTGQQLARVARRVRRFDLQRVGIPVVDWGTDESLEEVFTRYDAATGGGRR
ncbi:DUF58 domain-containing protein [Natrarchaeobius chitinivorans]|uniref:DUF58 domain-containing protein n=1 Tax=Natrarchaeobius chitinivorans TaxID=1679083 RepID=A0A3N6MNK7_NATCH|nr:DUF58 domain-containing protein [Natrarchaeobius chitinivorans]